MASPQLENVVRSGKFTGGGPSDTTTLMTSPSLAITGGPCAGAEAGFWLMILPAGTVMSNDGRSLAR